MNHKDISEIKRRLNPAKCKSTIYGYYTNPHGQLISSFALEPGRIPEEEYGKYLALFKKTLSGTIGQNLLPLEFDALQAETDGAYLRLNELRKTQLENKETLQILCEDILGEIVKETPDTQSVEEEQKAANWLILIMSDVYDIPYKDRNGEKDEERSMEVFSYMLCTVCPVKQDKPALVYAPEAEMFRGKAQEWVASAPVTGFMFPAFEDRTANAYGALFYTKDTWNTHDGMMKKVFDLENRMSPGEQQNTVQNLLVSTLKDECNLDLIGYMTGEIQEMLDTKKKDPEPENPKYRDRYETKETPVLTGGELKTMLKDSGVSEEGAEAFAAGFDKAFGEGATVPAVNVVESKQFNVKTPSVVIKTDAEHSNLIETKFIDGKKYITILVDGDMEVNGVPVR